MRQEVLTRQVFGPKYNWNKGTQIIVQKEQVFQSRKEARSYRMEESSQGSKITSNR